jgi:hypothetical protein
MNRLIVVLLGVLLCVSSALAFAAESKLAFETIDLKHLTAGEVAPMLGDRFRLAGEPAAPAERRTAPLFAPEGLTLVTAGHQSSQLLLAYGTPGAVSELRQLLAAVDAPRPKVRVTVSYYPAVPRKMTDWQAGPDMAGLTTKVKDFGESASLSLPAQALMEIGSAYALVTSSATELIALPPFTNWPQILLGIEAKPNADGTITLSIGVGLSERDGDPWKAIAEARAMPLTVNVKQRQQLAVALSRPDSGVTVMFTTSVAEDGK